VSQTFLHTALLVTKNTDTTPTPKVKLDVKIHKREPV
jgi:hypothetical protein